MGMVAAGNSLYISTLWQLWRFGNALAPGQVKDGYDRVYVPQVGTVTGDLDIHDLGLDGDGRLIFVNTLFSCLATTSDTHSFKPLWKPRFITKLAAEDRCHLNGLSMPHSPRWHQGRLWLHNSGTGEFGYADLEAGRFEPVAFCPGYLRGLSLHGGYAVMGLSKPRQNRTFTGLALDDALVEKQTAARCGLHVVDLNSGDTVHWLRLEGIVEELYDVVVLPGARRPMAIGMVSDEIRRVISIGEDGGA